MLRSLNSAIGGLKNHQVFMDVVGNNIANVNTTGFKASRVTFSTMLSQTLRAAAAPANGQGGLNAEQIGLGMATSSIDVLNTQGTLATTGKVTDLSVQGDGYFVQTDGLRKFYTRDGAFDLGADATLISPATGMHVMGWMADGNGKLNNATPPSSPISIPIGQAVTAKASSQISFNGNLNGAPTNMLGSGIVESTAVGGDTFMGFAVNTTDTITFTYNGQTYTTSALAAATSGPGGTTVAAVAADIQTKMNTAITAGGGTGDITVAFVNGPSATPGDGSWSFQGSKALSFGNSVSANNNLNLALKNRSMKGLESMNGAMTVYDSLGNAHNLTLQFQKVTSDQAGVAQSDFWKWTVTNLDGGTTIDSTGTNGVGSGFLKFDTSGKLQSVSTLSNGGATLAKPSQASVNFTYNNGAAAQALSLDFTQLTELQDGDTVAAAVNDGFATGTLQSFTVGQDGTITGSYSNGVSQTIGQIALATFANPGGLNHVGQNLYVESANSGLANIGTAMTSSRGQINSGQLEMSNVDLAQQFTDMIRAERGFQANSRIITTSDEMLQDLVNLKR